MGAIALAVATTSLADRTVDSTYSATLTAVGGVTPYNYWVATGGALPGGLSLNVTTGKISGTPSVVTTVPTLESPVEVADSGNVTDTAVLSIAVGLAPQTGTNVSVSAISCDTSGGKNGDRHLEITVSVLDDLGNVVEGAAVAIRVTHGAQVRGDTDSTDALGSVTFAWSNANSRTYTTTVTDVVGAGLEFDGITPANSFNK